MIEGFLLLLVLYLMVMLLRALDRVSKNPEEKGLGVFAYHESLAPKNSMILEKTKSKGGYA